MWQKINSFLQDHALALGMLTILIAAGRMVYDYLQSRRDRRKWREVPQLRWNTQGMAVITERAITTTPCEPHHMVAIGTNIPIPVARFIRYLPPSELAKLLLEVKTHSNTMSEEEKKDVCRAVTLAAARFEFHIPVPLVCLDARTHALYTVLRNQYDMCRVSMGSIVRGKTIGLNAVKADYQRLFMTAGTVLMHYAGKGPYPATDHFVATVNKNTKLGYKFTRLEVLAAATAYAALTEIPLPYDYHHYNDLTAALYFNTDAKHFVEEIKPHLTLVQ